MKYECKLCGGLFPLEDVTRDRDKDGTYYICWKCRDKGTRLAYGRRADFMRSYKGKQLPCKERM